MLRSWRLLLCTPSELYTHLYNGRLNHRTPDLKESSCSFSLDPTFVEQFANKESTFGFNGLGHVAYVRSYSRNGEEWIDTVKRVVEGTFQLLKAHMKGEQKSNTTNFDEQFDTEYRPQAEDMFTRMFNMKFLPPGRGLWAMGTRIVTERGLAAALNNCAFVSTDYIDKDFTQPFTFAMEALMLGVGVGFDVRGTRHKIAIKPNSTKLPPVTFTVPDSREGWVESVEKLLNSFLSESEQDRAEVRFDYSQVRPKGVPLKAFGGTASGPAPLQELHEKLRHMLTIRAASSNQNGNGTHDPCTNNTVDVRLIADMMNLIGRCVVMGNIRRSAEIAFGDPTDETFMNLKNYEKCPERAEWGWTSNNSVFVDSQRTTLEEYETLCEQVKRNGEPGFAWLDNMQNFSRMADPRDYKDKKVLGGNPCLEQSLEHMELCNLVETFPHHHADLDDFKRTLETALLYAKVVTLLPVHWEQSKTVMEENRRMGVSLSGIAQFLARENGKATLQHWCDEGYKFLKDQDQALSKQLNVNPSKKITSIKPSGTVSLLAGATPGMHYPLSQYCTRRMRLANTSPLCQQLADLGYHTEPCAISPHTTTVVSFPVDYGDSVKSASDVSMDEQFELAAFLQKHWADNQVSATVTFTKDEADNLAKKLFEMRQQLKGIALLPELDAAAYPQMPVEAITQREFEDQKAKLKTLRCLLAEEKAEREDQYCDNDVCQIAVQAP